MEVIPAIDLKGGKCVRLYQGDFSRETVFSEDPVAVAQRWTGLGAGRLHVVDLDGARTGAPVHLAQVRAIVAAAGVPVQLGGGFRSVDSVERALALGVERVVVGTAAVEEPALIEELCRRLGPSAIVVGVDAKDGRVAVRGWVQATEVQAADLVRQMEDLGAVRFLYTDVARDGTLSEPNFRAIATLVGQTSAHLVAAGGVSSVPHLLRLRELGVEGAVVGRALYTGDVDLREAMSATARGDGEVLRGPATW